MSPSSKGYEWLVVSTGSDRLGTEWWVSLCVSSQPREGCRRRGHKGVASDDDVSVIPRQVFTLGYSKGGRSLPGCQEEVMVIREEGEGTH